MYTINLELWDRFPSKELRERLGIDDTALVLQQNTLQWYGPVLRKEDDDWMKKCMEYEVEGPRPRRRPGERLSKRTVKHVNWTQSMDRGKWRKLIKDVWWSRWVWVGECFFWYRPTRVVPDQQPLNGCVCVCNLQLSLLHNVKRLGHMLLSQNWCQTLSRIVTHSSFLWDKPGTRSACFQPICCMIC